mmetsp:Transcript_19800/g.41230  ORF Transcript_19800/g.41230 Transcript_19800/m.41230 type:complete len:219 (-) Transcript_19800:157-813(-)
MTTTRSKIGTLSIQGSLSRPGIESKLLFERMQPIIGMIQSIQGGDGIFGQLNGNAIASMQGLSMFAIKGDTGFGAGIVGYHTLQNDMIGKNHAAETQNVRANGCDQYTRHGGMDDGSSRRHAVRRTTGGCRKNHAIRLHRRHVMIVTKTFQGRQVGGRSSINHDFIQDIVLRPTNPLSIQNATGQPHSNAQTHAGIVGYGSSGRTRQLRPTRGKGRVA